MIFYYLGRCDCKFKNTFTWGKEKKHCMKDIFKDTKYFARLRYHYALKFHIQLMACLPTSWGYYNTPLGVRRYFMSVVRSQSTAAKSGNRQAAI